MHHVRTEAVSTLSARVIRADGTVEDLGVVSVNGRPATRLQRFILKLKGTHHGSR